MNKFVKISGFFFLLTIMIQGVVYGQSNTQMIYLSDCGTDISSGESTLGCVSSDNQHIISCHYHGVKVEFILTDVNGAVLPRRINLPDSIFVSDMKRWRDTIYFCGSYRDSAIIGCFPEDLFFSAPVTTPSMPATPLCTIPIKMAYLSECDELNKMDLFESPESGEVIIAAVGRKSKYLIDPETYLYVIQRLGNMVNYQWVDELSARYGVFQDVAVTDNFIVATGIYNNGSTDQIAMTIIKKNDVYFGSNIPFVGYVCNETCGEMNTYYYSIETLDNDDVVISSLVKDPLVGDFRVSLHVFDAYSASFTNSQQIDLIQKAWVPNEILYFQGTDTLLLMHTNEYPILGENNTVIYRVHPYITSPYNTNTIYDTNSFYYSLDRYQDNRFLATGEMKMKGHSFFSHRISASDQSSCFLSSDVNVDVSLSPVSTYMIDDDLDDKHTYFFEFYPYIEERTLDGKCKE